MGSSTHTRIAHKYAILEATSQNYVAIFGLVASVTYMAIGSQYTAFLTRAGVNRFAYREKHLPHRLSPVVRVVTT